MKQRRPSSERFTMSKCCAFKRKGVQHLKPGRKGKKRKRRRDAKMRRNEKKLRRPATRNDQEVVGTEVLTTLDEATEIKGVILRPMIGITMIKTEVRMRWIGRGERGTRMTIGNQIITVIETANEAMMILERGLAGEVTTIDAARREGIGSALLRVVIKIVTDHQKIKIGRKGVVIKLATDCWPRA
jgi:hypothetical protein